MNEKGEALLKQVNEMPQHKRALLFRNGYDGTYAKMLGVMQALYGLWEAKFILGGQDVCFYFIFKTNFSVRDKIWGGKKMGGN